MTRITWPDGRDFAFTVFDDTDRATLDNVRAVYDLLAGHGFRTTKSVWPSRRTGRSADEGSTCEDEDYLAWLKNLQDIGFEIGYHMSASGSSVREETIRGLDRFARLFRHDPRAMANHVGCRENLYWGGARLSGLHRTLHDLLTRHRRSGPSEGHVEGSQYFWGDICKERITYVRNFVFPETNTLRMCPFMPYHDPARPYVNFWYASSNGSTVEAFNACLSERLQDRLEEEGGACIMYCHFAFGFQTGATLDSRFRFLMQRLGRKNGWFVPVSTLLDFLLDTKGRHIITDRERSRLERSWLARKLLTGTT